MLVTAIDRDYLPGLRALHNSMLKNSPGHSLTVMVYGDHELIDEVAALGVEVLPSPEIDAHLPVTGRWPVASPAMYARLVAPRLIGGDVVWLDADQIVLQPLDELFSMDLRSHACAAVPNRPVNESRIGGCPADMVGVNGIYSGLMVMNYKQWTAQRITERCFDAMDNSKLDFCFVVQSVLEFVLRGNFLHLPDKWQWFANRTESTPTPGSMVVHWHGNQNPWTHTVKNLALWNSYA